MITERARLALVWLLKLGLGAVWLYAGVLKFLEPATFAQEIANYRLFAELAPLGAATIPTVEIAVGALLWALPAKSEWLQAAATGSAAMMAVFTAAVVNVLVRGIDISCGCFGGGSDPVTSLTLARDVVLLLLSGALLMLAGERKAVPELERAS